MALAIFYTQEAIRQCTIDRTLGIPEKVSVADIIISNKGINKANKILRKKSFFERNILITINLTTLSWSVLNNKGTVFKKNIGTGFSKNYYAFSW